MSEIIRFSDSKEWEKPYKKGLDEESLEKLLKKTERQTEKEPYAYPDPEPIVCRLNDANDET